MHADKKILIKLYLLFIPVAFASYLFHEFGHWIVGELLGNDMVYSLNLVYPKSGTYINPNHNLYSSTGGPGFTILLAFFFFIIIEKYNSIFAYPVVIFRFVMRFFSLVFGGFAKQDEARISIMLGLGTHTIGIIVLLILFIIVWLASMKLKIDLKQNGYFITACILSQVLVIGTYQILNL